eukprot:scaffold688588_cov126-Attheya_sp.AAC.2
MSTTISGVLTVMALQKLMGKKMSEKMKCITKKDSTLYITGVARVEVISNFFDAMERWHTCLPYEATGIPPHTLLLCGQEEVQAMIERIVSSM